MDENNPNTRLNPTDGHMVVGVMIDDHYFIGRARAAQLFQFAPDPRETEKKRVVDARKELQDLLAIRQEVQRLFAGAKAANVPRYADYITSVHKGQDGITPPIILYSEQPLKIQQDETGAGWIQIPWDRRLVAIDGETQLAARFEAANRLQETRDAFVPLVFCHGRKQSWARQAFHDLNVLAVKPNPSLSLSMDARDPLTKVACEVAERVPFFINRVNKVQRQLKSSDPKVVTLAALRGACVTLAEGISGVKWGTRPVPINDPQRAAAMESIAVEWFTAATQVLGSMIEDRENNVTSAPAVLAAIGAMGHPLVDIADEQERRVREELQLEKLRSVVWTKGPAWDGIAGKISLKGTFSAGGSKENAYAVYGALNDPLSDGYKTVRSRAAA